MPNQVYHGPDLMAAVHVHTRDNDVMVTMRERNTQNAKGKRSLDLRITDLGNAHGEIFDWGGWKGAMAGEEGPHDTVSLRFQGDAATDGVIYGLWKATDQLFRHGRGLTLSELKLSIEKLPALFSMNPPELRVVAVMKKEKELRRGVMVKIADVREAPAAARRLFESSVKKEGLACVTLELCFPKAIKGDNTPLAIFAPSTDPDREAALARLQKYGAKFDNFYFDFANERLILEIAIWQATELLRRHYSESAGNRDREAIKTLHSTLRHLTLMHDVICRNQEAEMQEYVEAYPGLDFNVKDA
jgi:hypothetical protein